MDGNLSKKPVAQKKILKIVKEKDLYRIKNLIFISIEYEKILENFQAKNYLIYILVFYLNIEVVIQIIYK